VSGLDPDARPDPRAVRTDGGGADGDGADGDGADGEPDAGPSDEEIVQAASEAAEGVVLDRYKQSEIVDFDVTVTFEDGVLDVDVYLNAPDAGPDADRVVEEAVAAATEAVDELFGV